MATDTIKPGIAVFTNARISRKGGTIGGGLTGVISSVIRHPLSRHVLAVIVDPGTGNPDDRVVVAPRNLRQVVAV